ncbi:DUF3943 domain-containing protein [Mucilaginibacter sp. RB4R14]|uniref:DUF3943 domain-containing protein n=1 Tax=Mucilaginibacter aurantiaciroseus TaxID=2949308 RepID=UPI0020911328|nr:DUF3943 domain-containing protein [Mucilaginibacter aurantiaciroseus]MCO5934631.1 DUF3943 domain-containing protein [Mucilaginibacter aurantiaciroseus]
MKFLPYQFTLLVFAIGLCFPITLIAQTAQDANKLLVDTLAKPKPRRAGTPFFGTVPPETKRFGRAAAEWGLAQAIPFSYGKFIVHAPYSNITGATIWRNLNPGSWQWDKDIFLTNQFGHPYQGSLYFSSFRSNGYSFWQSAPAAVAGSYFWETFGENEHPSPNDFINTSFGGIVLGEMSYRLSNKIVNNRHRGFGRQMEEVAAFLFNPMNGLNRLLDGKWGKVYGNPKDRDSSQVSAEFDLGLRTFNSLNGKVGGNKKTGIFGRAKLLYGSRYKDYHTPFSNIMINVEVGKDDSSAVNAINVYGSLAGWELESNQDLKHLVILSANYDYISNEAFFYGGQSVKMNLFSQFEAGKKVKINTNIGTGPVLLAAVPSTYSSNGRNYDYTSGFGINGGVGVVVTDRFFASLDYRGAFLYTVNGNKSHYYLHTVNSELRYAWSKKLSVVGESGYFFLQGNYDDHPNVNKRYPFARLAVRYSVDF